MVTATATGRSERCGAGGCRPAPLKRRMLLQVARAVVEQYNSAQPSQHKPLHFGHGRPTTRPFSAPSGVIPRSGELVATSTVPPGDRRSSSPSGSGSGSGSSSRRGRGRALVGTAPAGRPPPPAPAAAAARPVRAAARAALALAASAAGAGPRSRSAKSSDSSSNSPLQKTESSRRSSAAVASRRRLY